MWNKKMIIFSSIVVIFLVFAAIVILSLSGRKDRIDDNRIHYEQEAHREESTENVNTGNAVYRKRYVVMQTMSDIIIYQEQQTDNGTELTFFDYAAISVELLPDDLKSEIEEGIFFDSEEELYAFLQTYSS